MDLAGLLRRVKRRTGYGDVNNTADQATLDLIDSVNDRSFEIWDWHDWDWRENETVVNLVSGTKDYTLGATDGDVILIDPGSGRKPLKKFTKRAYREWWSTRESDDDGGEVFGYIPIGRDASDNLKLRFVHTPTAAATVTVTTKKRLTVLTIADLTTEIAYFPEEHQSILELCVRADAYELLGKPDVAELRLQRADLALVRLVGRETAKPDGTIKMPPPSYYRRRRRLRGTGTLNV